MAAATSASGIEEAIKRAAQSGFETADRFLTRDAVCRSGVWALDYLLLGTGGIPRGRIVELFGVEHAGKTSLCLSAVRQAQLAYPDQLVAYFDVEGSLRDAAGVAWMRAFGIDTSRLVMPDVRHLEMVYDAIHKMVVDNKGDYSLIIFDSLAQSSPKDMMTAKVSGREKNKPLRDWGDKRAVAEEAGANTEFAKEMSIPFMDAGTTMIFVNQLRDLLALNQATKSDATVTPGGRALKYTYSARIRLERVGDIAEGTSDERVVLGSMIEARVLKSKFGFSHRATDRNTGGHLHFLPKVAGSPWDDTPDILWAAEQYGLVTKAGSWYTDNLSGIKAQGLGNFATSLKTTSNVWEHLQRATEAAVLSNTALPAPEEPDEDFE